MDLVGEYVIVEEAVMVTEVEFYSIEEVEGVVDGGQRADIRWKRGRMRRPRERIGV